jgi:peptidoglycan/LPS O-acetylase OafA/YrhL
MTQRNHFIDDLRGIAILVMILTHVTAYFPSDKIANAIWNWSHFSVPIFIFCSAYLFLQKNLHKPFSGFSYLKKRVSRLITPYYIFLLFFIPILLALQPQTVTFKYILHSLLLIGGVDINWLVLLFVAFALLLPVFVWLFQKYKTLFGLGFFISLASTILLLWYTPHISYKFYMWLPWSLLLYFTFIYQKFEKKPTKLLLLFITTAALFFGAYYVRLLTDHSVVLIHNKYPPNILYLSYGMSLFLLLSFFLKRFSLSPVIARPLHYFSVHSYQLYFIHYIILILIATFLPILKLHWLTFFIILIATTVGTQQILFFLQKRFFPSEKKS